MQGIGGAWIGVALACLAGPLAAHPHVFVDTGLEMILAPDGRVAAIRVTWTYDALFTLTLLEDLGLDPDGDLVLTEAETLALQGFDMQWPADFPGHLYAFAAEAPLALSGPSDWTAHLVGDQVTSSHLRHLRTPIRPQANALVVKSYDPEHYYAYTITSAEMSGASRGCAAVILAHDAAVADAALAAASEAYANATDLEAAFPQVGAYFADSLALTCPSE